MKSSHTCGRVRLSRWTVAALGVICASVAGAARPPVAAGATLAAPAASPAAAPRVVAAGVEAVVGAGLPGPVMPAGFLGLSTEYPTLAEDEGSDPADVDPVFEQLIRNLSVGGPIVLRVGGDSTDHTWWPVRGMREPGGVDYALTPDWLATTAALARAVSAKLILGINLEAGSQALAATEADRLVAGLGRARVAALEIGNEPELYDALSWYRTPAGSPVLGRPGGYSPLQFTDQFGQFARAMPAATIAGPASGSVAWGLDLDQFAAAEPRLGLMTVHVYPLKSCGSAPGSPAYPTIARLLAPVASVGMVASVAGDVAVAHARGIPIRLDELNSVSCGGATGVSNTFASALWAVNTMFALARAGFDGVNVHTRNDIVSDRLFSIAHRDGAWSADVAPEYYGLMLFADAAPAGSRLLGVTAPAAGPVTIWATRDARGTVRVTVVNTASSGRVVSLTVPGAAGDGALEVLSAPESASTQGVTFGGTSFGARTTTGLLAGSPRTVSVRSGAGTYSVKVPGPGVDLLTITEHNVSKMSN